MENGNRQNYDDRYRHNATWNGATDIASDENGVALLRCLKETEEIIYTFRNDELETILKDLSNDTYGTVLRCKGIVASQGTWYYFDMVPEEYEIREGQADFTGRVVVIGSHVK